MSYGELIENNPGLCKPMTQAEFEKYIATDEFKEANELSMALDGQDMRTMLRPAPQSLTDAIERDFENGKKK